MDQLVQKSQACVRLRKDFPDLQENNFELSSPIDRRYNCIAWAVNDNTKWWWPDPNAYWPTNRSDITVENFEEAFGTLGYERIETNLPPLAVERVVLYLKADVPTHAARQMTNGRWVAKLGAAWDVEHDYDAFCGGEYGNASVMFERPRDHQP